MFTGAVLSRERVADARASSRSASRRLRRRSRRARRAGLRRRDPRARAARARRARAATRSATGCASAAVPGRLRHDRLRRGRQRLRVPTCSASSTGASSTSTICTVRRGFRSGARERADPQPLALSGCPRDTLASDGIPNLATPRKLDFRGGGSIHAPMKRDSEFAIPEELPVLPLREMVVFPYMVLPLFVARERSIAAVEDALAGDRLLAARRAARRRDRGARARRPVPRRHGRDGDARAADGRRAREGAACRACRSARIDSFVEQRARALGARRRRFRRRGAATGASRSRRSMRACARASRSCCRSRTCRPRCSAVTANVNEPGPARRSRRLEPASLRVAEAQEVLEIADPLAAAAQGRRAACAASSTSRPCRRRSSRRRTEEMTRSQREHFLREQLRAIQAELGEGDGRASTRSTSTAPSSRRRDCPRRRMSEATPPAAAPRAHAPGRPRGAGGAHLPRVDDRAAVVARRRADRLELARGAADPRRGPRAPHRHQGPHPRVPRRAQAARRLARADPLLRRAARRRQDLARPLHRARDGPRVRAHLARRHARRGGDPRPPPHLRRRDAGPRSSRA